MTRQRRAGGGVDRLPSGRYRGRIVTPDGRRFSLGSFTTKRAAEAAYARSLTDQADGKPAHPSAVTTPTLADYAPAWVEARLTARGEPLRPRVRDLYVTQLRLHILPALGATRLAHLSTAKVRAWYTDLRGLEGPGASTAAKCYRLLRSILTSAVEDGLIASNPCTIKGAGVEPADERPIPTVAQAHQLASAIIPRMRAAVLLAAFVGLRKSELLGLRRGDIDLDGHEITIARQRQLDRNGTHLVGPPKTDAGRRALAIPAALVDDLRGHLEDYAHTGPDSYVFTGDKGGRSYPTSSRTRGPRPEPRSAYRSSTSTTSATLPAPSPPAPAPAPRSSCTASATPATKPPSATNTPPANATAPSPMPSTT